MNALHVLLQRLTSDQRGSIVVSFAMVFVFMVGSTFFVIDMARYNIVQSRLQSALDLTLISVGRNLPQYRINMEGEEGAALKQDVYDYFYANIPENFLSSTISQDDIKIDVGQGVAGTEYADAQYMKLEVSGKLPMLSAGFFDFFDMDIEARNMAVRRVRTTMEMVLALDNSSAVNVNTQEAWMGSTDEELMTLLRREATDLVTAVLNAAEASGTGAGDEAQAHVGLVPYTDFVNVGDIASVNGWLNVTPEQEVLIKGYQRPNRDWVRPAWLGCVSEPLPGSGSWSAANPLPADVLAPDGRFQPVLTLFGLDYIPKNLDKKNATEAFLVKNSGASSSGPGKGVFDGGVVWEHDNSGRIARVVNVRPYEENWVYRSPAESTRPVIPRVAEPHSFWINLAVESVYISNRGGLRIRSCPESKVHFLSSESAPLTNAIAGMQQTVTAELGKNESILVHGYGGGATIPVGLLWSWRMLSPKWRGEAAWGSSVLPRSADQGVRKVIVLFTKGGNQPLYEHGSDGRVEHPFKLSYSYKANKDAGSKTVKVENYNEKIDFTKGAADYFSQCPLNGLRTLDTNFVRPGNHDKCHIDQTEIGYGNGLGVDAVNAYMEDVCRNIKNDPANIEIYTVTLGDDPDGVIQACASSPDKHFHAGNVNELSHAFKAITGNVTDFRMIQ